MKESMKRMLALMGCFCFLWSVFAVNFGVCALSADAIPNGTPKIDGVVDDIWEYASEKVSIALHTQGKESNNASGWARLMWDSGALYVLGYVTDSTYSNAVTGDAWNTDSFEFFIDEQNKHIAIDKYIDQFRIDRNGTFSGMIAHTIADEAQFKSTYKGLEWAIKQVDGSTDYVVEYKIPWVKITPKADSTKIGIAFQINDDYNNDCILDGVITSEVVDTWDPSSYPVMKLVSTKAKASEGAAEAPSSQGGASQSATTSKATASAKGDSVESDTVSETQSDPLQTESEAGETFDGDVVEDDETVVTTVTEQVNEKLLRTVIIAAAAAVLVTAMICATVIVITFQKKSRG